MTCRWFAALLAGVSVWVAGCGPTAAPVAAPPLPTIPPPTAAPTAVPTRAPTVAPTQAVARGDVRATAVPVATAPTSTNPEVDIVDDLYSPPEITIRAGQTVTWRNYGAKVHDVVSRTNNWAPPFIQPGDRARITFNTPGRFEYTCSIHASMGGTVIVE
jgi:plastocyanin